MPSAERHKEVLNLDDVLPALWAARERSLLVPFVGAGLSCPFCKGWRDFIRAFKCAEATKLSKRSDAETLYRVADREASVLRRLSLEERVERLRNALAAHGESGKDLPKQAQSLMQHHWPLIVTTNYDDILPHLSKVWPVGFQAETMQAERRPPLLLGRSGPDCAIVVRSLSADDVPIIWYVQGFVPVVASLDEAADCYKVDRSRIDALVSDVVLGHQNYQRAINASPEFRRAFAEVFRRRSLLFIGSGLTESYFVNLIAETLHSLGPGSHSHFALFSKEELDKIDSEFLAVRLGITPVCYGADYDSLPEAISRITEGNEKSSSQRRPAVSMLGYTVPSGTPSERHSTPATVDVRLCFGKVPAPSEERAIVLSGGREPDRRPKGGRYTWFGGPMADSFFKENPSIPRDVFHEIGQPEYNGRVFRIGRPGAACPVFIATSGADKNFDARDLSTISDATQCVLDAVAKAGFKTVSMGVLSAGNRAPSVPVHSLIAQLSGIRKFLQNEDHNILTVEICVNDRAIWDYVTADRVPVLDLLTSNLARVLVRVEGADGDWDEYALSVGMEETVETVIRRYGIEAKSGEIVIRPRIVLNKDVVNSCRVFPGMVIEVHADKGSP